MHALLITIPLLQGLNCEKAAKQDWAESTCKASLPVTKQCIVPQHSKMKSSWGSLLTGKENRNIYLFSYLFIYLLRFQQKYIKNGMSKSARESL